MEKEIVNILQQNGPQTGAQLVELVKADVFSLWRACNRAHEIQSESIGQRFLRLDRAVPGYARLSPSIRRQFLTYTLLGLKSQPEQRGEQAEALRRVTAEISQEKRDLARESMISAVSSLENSEAILGKTCFIIAGDIVYQMSHRVPRPEKSTGEMVSGSDLDIIVIVDDELPLESVKALDKVIYRKKHFLLVQHREEVDYIVKNIAKVKKQLKFDTFESMIACKILHEGEFLYGSASVFETTKGLVESFGVPRKLDEMAGQALQNRQMAEDYLLDLHTDSLNSEYLHLFYTREEGEEIY